MATPHPNDLDFEDIQALQDDQLVLPQVAGGKRKVSAAFLTPPASDISSSSSSSATSTASVRFRNIATASGTFDLPDRIESVAAVEWCGFAPNAAFELYSRYANRPDPQNNPDEVIDYMLADILSADRRNELSPAESMNRMGLSVMTQAAIMDPLHEDVRGTETITSWVLETISINWKTLLHLKSKLKAAAVRSRAKKKPKINVGAVFPPQQQQQAPSPSHTATVQSTLADLSMEHNLPRAHVAVVTAPPAELPNHVVLYKAKAAVEMEEWINEDGRVRIGGLLTYGGGDFNPELPAYYWTREKATADQYHKFATRRCPYSEIWMIQVQLPESFIDSLRTRELWYGHDWKEFVWYCRKKKIPPSKYDEYCNPGGVDLIKGHVCKTKSCFITNVDRNVVQSFLNEGNLLYNPGGQKSTQWAFVQTDSSARFAREIKGKIHIEVTPSASVDK